MLALFAKLARSALTTNRPTTAPPPPALDLSALIATDPAALPPLEPYTARDGAQLAFRLYPSQAETGTVLVLLHGSGCPSSATSATKPMPAAKGSA